MSAGRMGVGSVAYSACVGVMSGVSAAWEESWSRSVLHSLSVFAFSSCALSACVFCSVVFCAATRSVLTAV